MLGSFENLNQASGMRRWPDLFRVIEAIRALGRDPLNVVRIVAVQTQIHRFEAWAQNLGRYLFLPCLGGMKSMGPYLVYGIQ